MDLFVCVVGANCNSPTPQFAHIVFRPYYEFTHVEGRIAHILSCASSLTLPLHVYFLDVGEYTCN